MVPKDIPFDESTEILVWFYDSGVMRDLSKPIDLAALTKESIQVLDRAMEGIKSMTKRVVTTMHSIKVSERPDTVEMKFGLKLTSGANVFIARAGVDAQIEVTLIWNNSKETNNPDVEDEMTS